MRTRTMIIGGAAVAVTLGAFGAGTANAASFYGPNPGKGPLIGVALDHGETMALANSPVPGWLYTSVPTREQLYYVKSDSHITGTNGRTTATVPDVIGEAAAHPGGSVSITLSDPASYGGTTLGIYQSW